ncbi:PAQR family membrane homeostasis protein TrhA [Olsenella massiliensis]|uniref:PAQR family membrane homeostasis protein TrhA n=1 Tax=Olsenella massiliensis TaxID=1622075 RepID=UPI0009EB1171|nr:hemolysin III family protein [Olsenella massiliensis]
MSGRTGVERARRPRRQYSTGEEVANAVSHGVGVLLSIAALVLLVMRAVAHGGGVRLLAALLMGGGLILEFLLSTLYHALVPPSAKSVFRTLDHSAIYLLIAGSYAPFALVTLAGRGGLELALLVWGVAAAGIVAEVALRERQPAFVSALIYVAMGWLIVVRFMDIWELMPRAGFWLLVAGGVCYTVGVGFYVAKRVPYLHFVWHLWVLAGATCVTLSALLFVV